MTAQYRSTSVFVTLKWRASADWCDTDMRVNKDMIRRDVLTVAATEDEEVLREEGEDRENKRDTMKQKRASQQVRVRVRVERL